MAPHPVLLAVTALICAMISMTFGTSYAKSLFPLIGAEGATTFRMGFAALLLLAIWRPWRMELSPANARAILLYGVALGALTTLFYMAVRTIPLGVAVALEFVGPLAVAVGFSRRLINFVWIGLAAAGVISLLPLDLKGQHLDPSGLAFALGAGACWALYIILGKQAGHLPAGQVTSLGITIAALVVFPVGVGHAGQALFDPGLILPGLIVGALSSALPFPLEMFALRRLRKETFAILLSMEPAIAALAGFLVLDERLTTNQWLAIASIILASVGSAMTARSG